MMKDLLVTMLLMVSINGASQNVVDSISSSFDVSHSLVQQETKQKELLLYQAGDCFQMSGYMQYAAIGTGALAGVVAIVASNKDGDGGDKLRTVAYMIGGFALAFEFASITYKIKGGRRLKLSASADGASVALNF